MIIDSSADSIQILPMPGTLQRAEGIAFSMSGNVIAVATADTNTVFLFRRSGADSRFDETPYCTIRGPRSGLNYPHDVSFGALGGDEFLAVAQRMGSIALYLKRHDETYTPEPAIEIRGPKARLNYSDGVALLPPAYRYLAVCNLGNATISFYRRRLGSSLAFEDSPCFELQHRSLGDPDGLAFSGCGRWLAVANHGQNSVSIFARRHPIHCGGRLRYGPEPQVVIRDPTLRYPHSVAFTRLNHLVVTNAGANYFSVFAPMKSTAGTPTWSTAAVLHQLVTAEDDFRAVNVANKMEGGPKGIAIHGNTLAVCAPEFGVKLYRFNESPAAAPRTVGASIAVPQRISA